MQQIYGIHISLTLFIIARINFKVTKQITDI